MTKDMIEMDKPIHIGQKILIRVKYEYINFNMIT